MGVARSFGYWIGAVCFVLGLVWNAMRVAGLLPPDLDQPAASIGTLLIGTVLIGRAKVRSLRDTKRTGANSKQDTYLAWLQEESTPDFAPPLPQSTAERTSASRRAFTPLEPEVAYPINLGRTRFDIRFPQRKTESWVGGMPSLPADVLWPTRNGMFEPFVAQIAVSDLSPLIWGGCFRDADPQGASLAVFEHTVLYLSERGDPRRGQMICRNWPCAISPWRNGYRPAGPVRHLPHRAGSYLRVMTPVGYCARLGQPTRIRT